MGIFVPIPPLSQVSLSYSQRNPVPSLLFYSLMIANNRIIRILFLTHRLHTRDPRLRQIIPLNRPLTIRQMYTGTIILSLRDRLRHSRKNCVLSARPVRDLVVTNVEDHLSIHKNFRPAFGVFSAGLEGIPSVVGDKAGIFLGGGRVVRTRGIFEGVHGRETVVEGADVDLVGHFVLEKVSDVDVREYEEAYQVGLCHLGAIDNDISLPSYRSASSGIRLALEGHDVPRVLFPS